MNESPTASPEKPPASSAARIGWGILILATLYVCYFSHLGAIGFVGPDEPRYAWIARDMAETGDWVTPRLYGKPWFEKPPLYYWGAAASFKVFGVSDAAARLPSAISALLATLALAWLAWRMYGGETARWLLLLLPTTVGMIGFSHAAATDMPFSGMLTIAMVCAAVVLRLAPTARGGANPAPTNTSTPWAALILFGFFLGLAVLAKGPAGIILCGGAVFFWAIFTKRWRDAFRLLHPAAIAAFCLTALPWYILCARRNPDFFRIFIIEHNFKRYLTPEFQHIQPFWFYGPILLLAMLPWTVPLLWSALSGFLRLWRSRSVDHFSLLLLCWSGFTILFFTISKSKLPGYVLPAIAPIALLTTHWITSRLSHPKGARWLFSAVGLTLILLGVLASRFSDSIPFVTDLRPAPAVTLLTAVAIVGGVLTTAFALFRRFDAAFLAAVISILGLMTVDTSYLWQLDDGISARPVVQTALEHSTEGQITTATTYKLPRALKFQVDFYLHRETEEWTPSNPEHSVILTNRRNTQELTNLGARCLHYVVYPAVALCEGGSGESLLMRGAAGGGKLQ
ncbi:MAG: glycosyltransferase family 39 protein [Candidatus Acidiferrum sp.]